MSDARERGVKFRHGFRFVVTDVQDLAGFGRGFSPVEFGLDNKVEPSSNTLQTRADRHTRLRVSKTSLVGHNLERRKRKAGFDNQDRSQVCPESRADFGFRGIAQRPSNHLS